jgi:hypothetical protein
MINFEDYFSGGYYITNLYRNLPTQLESPTNTRSATFLGRVRLASRLDRAFEQINRVIDPKTHRERQEAKQRGIRHQALRQSLLPPHFPTLTLCMNNFIPDSGWELHKPDAFQVPPHVLPEINRALKQHFDAGDIGWQHVWYSLDTLMSFLAQFETHISNAIVLGIGLHKRYPFRG